MKKTLTLLLLFVATITFSQEKEDKFKIEKGTWVLEGDFYINASNTNFTNSSDDNDRFNFGILPKLGYAVNDNLVLGLGLGYGYSRFKHYNGFMETSYTTNSYSIMPYVKKFFPITSKLAFHVQGETRFSFLDRDYLGNYQSNSVESYDNTFYIGVRPGIVYSLSKNVLLKLNFGSLGYSHGVGDEGGDDKVRNNSFGLNLSSSSLLLGASILLD